MINLSTSKRTGGATQATEGNNGGKYLTFALGKESYGIQILKVREIIRITDLTKVPCLPEYMRGVLNLRGKVIPVADLRLKFGLGAGTQSDRNCIVVVELKSETTSLMGLIVDSVEEVVNIPAGDIEPPPDFGLGFQADYILGMAKVKGTVKTLLDISKVIQASVLRGLNVPAVAA